MNKTDKENQRNSFSEVRQPLVSIIVPTRNRPVLLQNALKYIAAQSLQNIEVIIIDDGSSAGVRVEYEGMRAKLDDRFIFEMLSGPTSKGMGAATARNRGIQLARGEYIAFCDDDDHWDLQDHLEVGSRVMSKFNSDFYFANMRGENAGKITTPQWLPTSKSLMSDPMLNEQPVVYEVGLRDLMSLFQRKRLHLNTVIISRALVSKVGQFWVRLHTCEDLDFIMRALDKAHRILYRPDCVAVFNSGNYQSIVRSTTTTDCMFGEILFALHVRGICSSSKVRKCARVIESWNYRRLSIMLFENKQAVAALSFVWQAFLVYPTPKNLVVLILVVLKVLFLKIKSQC